jgi:hypothetical protein
MEVARRDDDFARPRHDPETGAPMETLVQAADSVLRSHPAPALRLSELSRLVCARQATFGSGTTRLRSALERRPDLFRVLDPQRGPWRFVPEEARPPAFGEPWVVVVGDPPKREQGTSRTDLRLRLRASVRWLGLGIDVSSPRELARWQEVALAEGEARAALRPAA